jgi:hypothetical protein
MQKDLKTIVALSALAFWSTAIRPLPDRF